MGRVSENYPRLIALSHPQLHLDDFREAVLRYSQHKVDLINFEDIQYKTLLVNEVLFPKYQLLPYLIQIDQEGYLTNLKIRVKKRAAVSFLTDLSKAHRGYALCG